MRQHNLNEFGAKTTQSAIELLERYVASSPVAVSGSSMGAAVTQMAIEILMKADPNPNVYVSQTVIEVLWKMGIYEPYTPPVPPVGTQTISYAYVS